MVSRARTHTLSHTHTHTRTHAHTTDMNHENVLAYHSSLPQSQQSHQRHSHLQQYGISQHGVHHLILVNRFFFLRMYVVMRTFHSFFLLIIINHLRFIYVYTLFCLFQVEKRDSRVCTRVYIFVSLLFFTYVYVSVYI